MDGLGRFAISVSIPIGFSNPLQREVLEPPPLHLRRVSIPIGFSNPLQRSSREANAFPSVGFNPYWVF